MDGGGDSLVLQSSDINAGSEYVFIVDVRNEYFMCVYACCGVVITLHYSFGCMCMRSVVFVFAQVAMCEF